MFTANWQSGTVHQIFIFHQEGELGGKIRRITNEGKVMEEPLDTTNYSQAHELS